MLYSSIETERETSISHVRNIIVLLAFALNLCTPQLAYAQTDL